MTSTGGYRIEELTGARLVAALGSFGDLRITVFREYPFLYHGNLASERAYAANYAASEHALMVGAFHGDQLIGAATAAPMADHQAEFSMPFNLRGMDINQICYFGESVLLPAWRRRGIGHLFFDRREARARELGFTIASFCSLIRPTNHPARPADYWPLEKFWRGRGYAPVDDMIAQVDWREVGQVEESPHPMQFWVKYLG